MLASGAKDNRIRLWTPSGACLAVGDGHAGAVSALAFSRKAPSFLVSGGVDKILKVPIAHMGQLTAHRSATPTMLYPGLEARRLIPADGLLHAELESVPERHCVMTQGMLAYE